ncbi:hypothetical protein ACVXHA_29875 [Escherichia coli]
MPRLMLASLIGALILWLSDQIILWLTRVWMEVSTGSVTASIGAPLLPWLLPRLRSISAPDMRSTIVSRLNANMCWRLPLLAVCC